jgi:hypothetical protein
MAVPKLEGQRWAPKRYDYHYNLRFCLTTTEVSLDSAVDEETHVHELLRRNKVTDICIHL